MRRLPNILLITILALGARTCLLAQDAPATETAPVQAPAKPDQLTAEQPEKEKPPPKGVIHMQSVKDVPKVHATQPCNNYSWAASLEGALAVQNVYLKQRQINERAECTHFSLAAATRLLAQA